MHQGSRRPWALSISHLDPVFSKDWGESLASEDLDMEV